MAGLEAEPQAGANGSNTGSLSTPDAGGQFFTNEQPTLGNGSPSTPILRSAAS